MKVFAQLFRPQFRGGVLSVGVLVTAANDDGTQAFTSRPDSEFIAFNILGGDTRDQIRAKAETAIKNEFSDQTATIIWWCSHPRELEDLATQAELDAHAATPHGGGVPLVDQRTADSAAVNALTLTNVLSVTLPSTGTYRFTAIVHIQGNATTSTPGIAIGGTSVPSAWRWVGWHNTGLATTEVIIGNQTGTLYPTTGLGLVAIGTTTTLRHIYLEGTVTVTAVGTFAVQMSRTAGTGSFTAEAGSILAVSKL